MTVLHPRYTYAIGDVQGCYHELRQLIRHMQYDPQQDQVCFVGDLVNRGPQSLEVLQYIYDLGEHAQVILGNHDIHLLAVAYGAQPLLKEATFKDVLDSPECNHLLAWLKNKPFIYFNPDHAVTLVHAGIPPQWSLKESQQYAQEAQTALSQNTLQFLKNIYGNQPTDWNACSAPWDRLRYIVNALTRMRFCTPEGKLNFEFIDTAESPVLGWFPWFKIATRKTQNEKIIFGHWAALKGKTDTVNAMAIDTGCVWGHRLTAIRLNDFSYFSVPAQNKLK